MVDGYCTSARPRRCRGDVAYQYDSLAADLMVKVIERYLAEYRYLFREDPEARNLLLSILDIFVTAGWPSARQLSYGLEEIFR
jgi:hypothetical protein